MPVGGELGLERPLSGKKHNAIDHIIHLKINADGATFDAVIHNIDKAQQQLGPLRSLLKSQSYLLKLKPG